MCRDLAVRIEFGRQNAVDFAIHWLIPLHHVVAESTFVLHAGFLQDASRGRIVGEVFGPDAVHAAGEAVSEYGL